jgi:hypothetical protein
MSERKVCEDGRVRVKVKVRFLFLFNEVPCHEDVWWSDSIASRILHLGTRFR